MNQPGRCWECRRDLPNLADLTKRDLHLRKEHGYLGLEEEGGEENGKGFSQDELFSIAERIRNKIPGN